RRPTAEEFQARADELAHFGQRLSVRSLRRYWKIWHRSGGDRLALAPPCHVAAAAAGAGEAAFFRGSRRCETSLTKQSRTCSCRLRGGLFQQSLAVFWRMSSVTMLDYRP